MKKRLKRFMSAAMAAVMLFSSVSFTYAEEQTGPSYFDFEFANYDVKENDGELKVKIKRYGSSAASADVAFKAADFLSSYGVDYEILDEKGKPLEKVSGFKPDPSEFVYDETASGSGLYVLPEANDDVASSAALDVYSESEPVDPSEPVDKTEFNGSPLLNAQAQYLDLPKAKDENDTLTNSDIEKSLKEMYEYFGEAEGAQGMVHFKSGETEKELTIVINDNDKAESDKLFMLCILGAQGDNVEMKANPTTYVSILDDEEYENPYVAIESTPITLTADNPTGMVKIKRSSGLQYFTSVYVSTVDIENSEGCYDSFVGKTVAFVPGETEKTVEVTATDFSKDARFGVKLEALNSTLGNTLATVNISSKTETAAPVSAYSADDTDNENIDDNAKIETFAAAKYLGVSNALIHGGIFSKNFWSASYKGNGSVEYGNSEYAILNANGWNDSTLLETTEKVDTAGVRSIGFSGDGTDKSYFFYYYFNVSQTKGFNGINNAIYQAVDRWNNTKKEKTSYYRSNAISFTKQNARKVYLQFMITNNSSAWPVQVRTKIQYTDWTKYTFSKLDSGQNAVRNVYDFTSGTVSQSFFDGETSRYIPLKGLDMQDTDGNEVAGYYANNNDQVVFSTPENVKKYGYILDKVYFYNSAQNKYVVRSADNNGVLKLIPNQDFTAELYNSGVISSLSGNASDTIYVKPVYKQDMIKVSIGTEHGFINLNKDYGVKTEMSSNGAFKRFFVPRYSIMRVQFIPNADRSPLCVRVNKGNGYESTYYKEGEYLYSTTPDPEKTEIKVSDFTKAEFVVDSDTISGVIAKTSAQNLYIGYSPDNIDDDLAEFGSFAGAVVDADDTSDNPKKANKNGTLEIANVEMGSSYNFRGFAPEGYYVEWKDMTGDTNNDGVAFGPGDIEKTERNYDFNDKSNNFREIVGSRLNIKLNKDNTRYYYVFMPAVTKKVKNIRGKVQRRKADMLTLSRTKKESDIPDLEPVSGIFINAGESAAMTDENGEFTVPNITGKPWGAVSAYYTVDGIEYSTEAEMSGYNNYIVPAMSAFEVCVNGVKADYKNNKLSEGQSLIQIKNDTLTIDMQVQGNAITTPNDVRFFIHDANGVYLRDFTKDLFKVKKTVNNTTHKLDVSLSFNANAVMNSGEKIYAQFADQYGNWYNTIPVGYTFISDLTLDKFIFPLIGSSSLEGGITSGIVEDIIGNPLGNVSVGELSNATFISGDTTKKDQKPIFGSDPQDYYSWGAQAELAKGNTVDEEYKWLSNTFSYGAIGSGITKEKKFNSKKDKKEKEETAKKAAQEVKDKGEDESKKEEDATKTLDEVKKETKEIPNDKGSSFSTESKFKFTIKPLVGFSLTITQRLNKKTGKFDNYFEDLTFLLGIELTASASVTISTPIGIDVIITAKLNGTVVGVYHMYCDYDDDWQIEGATPYTSEDFGVFKKFGDDSAVRREGYIFIDPVISISIGLDLKVAKIEGTATFTFDMDFQFTDEVKEKNDTKSSGHTEYVINTYGDMKIDLSWSASVLGFTVYKKQYDNIVTVKLFNSEGTNKHINLKSADALLKSLSVDEEETPGAKDPIGNEPVSRAYLKNRGGWNSGSELQLFSADTTTETVLRNGSAGSNNVQMAKINDNEILMLFIDDVPSRNNVNKRALYYSIGDGSKWSEPVILNDDGTLDDYPTLQDLGDGRIFAAWSSADKAFDEGATVEDALKSLNIQAVFFDKATKSFGNVETLTHTTEEDFTADMFPQAAYNAETDRLILYYTKTEYNNLDTVDSISKADSVNAYIFYENGKWSNDGAAYTDDELNTNRMKQMAAAYGMSFDEYKQYYRDQWYGQRFLDLRLSDTAALTRVVETSAINYNGLALFTWVNDWDNDLSTAFDRDVFVQVYNFSENSFTHIIRITDATSGYYNPLMGRSAEATYMFFGALDEGEESGNIMYLNLSEVIKNDYLTKVTDGGVNYYKLSENMRAAYAVDTLNVMDYDVSVDSNGKIYLFWTDTDNNAQQIMTAMLNKSEYSETDDVYWSEQVQLTDIPERTFYTGIGAAIINDVIYIGAGRGNYDNEADNKLVMLKHIPTSDVVVDEIQVEKPFFKAGEMVEVSAVVRNKDLLPEFKPVDVIFEINGQKVDTQRIDNTIPGGSSSGTTTILEIPENPVDITFSAYISGSDKKEVTIENEANITIDERELLVDEENSFIYKFTAENNGGKTSEPFTVTATYGDTVVTTYEVPAMETGAVGFHEMPIKITDEIFGAERDASQLDITAEYGEDTLAYDNEIVYNPYNWEAVDNIAKITGIKFEDSYTVQMGESIYIQPEIYGVDDEALRVEWINSSNGIAAEIDAANIVYGDVIGQSVLTGIIVPYSNEITFNSNGEGEYVDWRERLPESSIVTVTVVVNVVDETESVSETTEADTETTTEADNSTETTTAASNSSSRSSGGGSGGSSSRLAAQTTTTTEADTEITTNDVSENTTVNVIEENTETTTTASIFNDIAGHWAEDIIENAASDGIVSGYEDNSFRPNNSITRAELIAVLYNSGLASTETPEMLREFADVDYTEWYAKYLTWAVGNGIITGYDDNTFRGNNVITRQEMAVVISKFIAFTGKSLDDVQTAAYNDEADIAAWAKPYVDDITAKAVTSGDNYGKFNPEKDLTRAETAVIITRIK